MLTINNPYLKAGQQNVAISASSPLQVTAASRGSLTTALSSGSATINRIRMNHEFDSGITTAMIDSEAFSIPVSRLIDIWITRFGNKWINIEEIEEDEFFSGAFRRLKQLGEVEVHFLTDRARYVCRMPEQ